MDGWKCLASFSSTSRQQLRRQRRVLPLYTQHLTPWELQRKLPSRLAAFPHFHLPSFPASSAFSPVSPRVSRCREGGKDKKYGGKSHTLEGSNGHRSTRRCPVDRVASPSRPAASYHGRLPVYTTQHPVERWGCCAVITRYAVQGAAGKVDVIGWLHCYTRYTYTG